MLWRQGLPPDAMILAPSFAATPMRQPVETWTILVLAADVLDDTDPDREGEVEPVVLEGGDYADDVGEFGQAGTRTFCR